MEQQFFKIWCKWELSTFYIPGVCYSKVGIYIGGEMCAYNYKKLKFQILKSLKNSPKEKYHIFDKFLM